MRTAARIRPNPKLAKDSCILVTSPRIRTAYPESVRPGLSGSGTDHEAARDVPLLMGFPHAESFFWMSAATAPTSRPETLAYTLTIRAIFNVRSEEHTA